ncbi:16S rRNA (adenine(1518)-N(6)/adenine(1519)-N(6))-dimethyltransferase RsmA [bacterium]|nr:16S rRNA (adenine(1518)-N(6)/adenine(1519)-N(6))-dimethyltransferase RsmA [bacterium]
MNLLNQTKQTLRKYGLRLRKGLGQNLLIDDDVLEKIVEAASLTKDDIVLEIGPGLGVLTKRLASLASKVIAVEIDSALVGLLGRELRDCKNVEIIEADILKTDLSKLLPPSSPKLKVVANLPYYITTPVIIHLLEKRDLIESMIIMIQKEVGERIIASPGGKDYGSLSILVQYYAIPELITPVASSSFIPRPKVDSSVIKLKVADAPRVKVDDEKLFFRVVRGAFGKRRKMLPNALSGAGFDKEKVVDLLNQMGLDPKQRGETLSIQEFAALSNLLFLEL